MDKVIRTTRRNFIATIVLVVVSVVAASWVLLAVFNEREIATPAKVSEIHRSSQKNPELAAYMEEQKDYEAHFITLASDIKIQEAGRVTQALAITSIAVVLLGIGIALVAAKKLMKPVIRAYESQERFIQDAAHELRNPLAALTIALQQADPSKNEAQLLKTFRRQTKRLVHINEDLLFLERSARQEPTFLNLSDLLSDVCEELQIVAARKKVKLKLQTDESITKKMVAGDYVRLTKNIVDNAIKYTHHDTAVVITQRSEKNNIVITVQDHGIGIPEKDQEHIGDRFFRASNTAKIDGTGLGLAIVRKILNSYGGSFNITSKVGSGTTVRVTLPT